MNPNSVGGRCEIILLVSIKIQFERIIERETLCRSRPGCDRDPDGVAVGALFDHRPVGKGSVLPDQRDRRLGLLDRRHARSLRGIFETLTDAVANSSTRSETSAATSPGATGPNAHGKGGRPAGRRVTTAYSPLFVR